MSVIVTPRRACALVIALALTAVGAAATAGPANADPSSGTLGTTCTGTQEIKYSPGLRLHPRTVHTTGTTSYDCQLSVVTTGTSGFSVTDERSCLSSVMTSNVKTITWDTEQESVLDLTATTVTAGGVTTVTKTGTVISGLFAGADVVEVVVGPEIAGLPACLTSQGLKETTEEVTLEITPVPLSG